MKCKWRTYYKVTCYLLLSLFFISRMCFIHAAVVVGVEDEEDETLSLSLRGDHLPLPVLDMYLVSSHKGPART